MPTDPRDQPSLVLGAGTTSRRARRAARRRSGGGPRVPPVVLLAGALGLAIVLVTVAWSVGDDRGGPAPRATDVDPAIASTGAVLDHWWGAELARLGLDWTPVGARLTDGDGTVSCDGEVLVLDAGLRDNAFAVWCEEGHAVAFDPGRFAADEVATQVVLAHEWGHVVQFTNPTIDLPTVDPLARPAERELQADCFAGAWAAEHVVGEFHGMMLARVGSFGDPSWVPLDHEHGHGTATERRDAYDLGVAGGVDACLPPSFDPR